MTNYFSNIFHNISNLIMDCYDAHKNKWVDIILSDSHPHIGDVVYTKKEYSSGYWNNKKLKSTSNICT